MVEGYRPEELVVIFTDAHSFSRLMRELGGARVLGFLDELYTRLGEEIVSRGGEIVNYLGDGILAVVPVAGQKTSASRRAVAAGLAIRRVYLDVVSEHGLRTPTEMEVGVSAGVCERGVVGHESRRTDDVFGEAVNIAAVIGHHRGIAITAPVRDALGNHYPTKRLPGFTPKWLDEPVEIWEIDGA